MTIRFLFLTLLISFFCISLSNPEPAWVKDTDKNGITVYLREYKGSKLKEFKAQTRIKVPLKKVVNLLLDFKAYPKWVFSNQGTFLIEKKSATEYVYYTVVKCPEPTNDRDLIALLKVTELTDTKCVIKTSCLPKYIGEKPKIVRVKEFSGMWELTAISENETQVVMQSHSEPGGTVPAWLINYMISTGPYKTLANMQELLEGKAKKK